MTHSRVHTIHLNSPHIIITVNEQGRFSIYPIPSPFNSIPHTIHIIILLLIYCQVKENILLTFRMHTQFRCTGSILFVLLFVLLKTSAVIVELSLLYHDSAVAMNF